MSQMTKTTKTNAGSPQRTPEEQAALVEDLLSGREVDGCIVFPLHAGLEILDCTRRFLDARGAKSWEEAWRMKAAAGGGGRKLSTRLAEAACFSALQEAYALIEGPGPWRRCLALEMEIAKFERDLWPCWKLQGLPHSKPSKLYAALYRVFIAYQGKEATPPKTQSAIHMALTRPRSLTLAKVVA